ncbi:hypothetical protein ACP70R_012963 [Stipagrostis hirtigluma subsp. patula]
MQPPFHVHRLLLSPPLLQVPRLNYPSPPPASPPRRRAPFARRGALRRCRLLLAPSAITSSPRLPASTTALAFVLRRVTRAPPHLIPEPASC